MDQYCFRKCKAILFDFGGTLDSDGGHWLDRFYRIYLKEGIDVPFLELKDAFYYADDICCKDPDTNNFGLNSLLNYHVRLQFKKLGFSFYPTGSKISQSFLEDMLYYLRRNSAFLKSLRSRYKLGVVSNSYGNLPVVFDQLGISKLLDTVIDSERVGVRKPDPSIFKIAIDELKVSPSSTVFVGDSYERDMIPCKDLGMKVIWMKGPNPRIPEDPPVVDAIITNLMQLKDLFL